MSHYAIVGASLAGLAAADALREEGFDGTITVIDGAAELPSDRPPLSKQVLAGTMDPAAAHQPVAPRLPELDLDLRLGTRAVALSAADKSIELSDGSTLRPDGIVLATGGSPRRLPTDLDGVHVLRTLDDCLAIKADFDASPQRVVVIGAGFIGAEVAATARSLGLDVTMIEAQDRPMQRVLPGEIGDFVTDLHRGHGVDVRLGVGLDGFLGGTGTGARVAGVRLVDGTEVLADVVVVGIGVTPSVDWLDGSGLELDNGIVCDETCLAAPDIVAAGDVASWLNLAYGEQMRVEQWENAIEQGRHVGRRLLAGGAVAEPFTPIPWFWTDQYDRKIQLAGRVGPGDDVAIVDGSVDDQRFVALFRRGDRCVGVLGVNRPRHVVQTRMKMADGGLSWSDALAAFA